MFVTLNEKMHECNKRLNESFSEYMRILMKENEELGYLSTDPLAIILLDFKRGLININEAMKKIEELPNKKKHRPCSRQC